MRFPAQEVIIGALLTLAAFAMGMMWASAGAPSAHDTTHNTGEFKFGEWLTAFATIALVVVTYLLFQATQLLAKSAQEDSHNRKIQATADAWMDLRAELEFPNLTNTPAHEINAMGKEVVPQLRKLEGFSQIVNSGVFDLETFSNVGKLVCSASWEDEALHPSATTAKPRCI